MLSGAATNDTISVKVGTQSSGQALALTLSDAQETIDISAAKGSGGALTITATNFDIAADTIKLGASVSKGSLSETSLSSSISSIEKAAITDGVLVLTGSSLSESDLTITNALSALADSSVSLTNAAVLFVDKSKSTGDTYLILTGTSGGATTDDVAVKLTGTIRSFDINEQLVTFA